MPSSARGQRSIQQTATHRAYESTKLRCGILSGKVASAFTAGTWATNSTINGESSGPSIACDVYLSEMVMA